MTKPKDIIESLQKSINIASTFEAHINNLTQEVARLRPSYDACKALLDKHGFDKETTLEDNLRVFIDDYARMVAENTKMKKEMELVEEFKKSVRELVD